MSFNSSITGQGDVYEYPESKWETFNSVMAPIALIGLVLFGYLHYRSDPFISTRHGRGRCFVSIHGAKFYGFYMVPCFLIAGGSNDDETLGWIIASIAVEVVINSFLFRHNHEHKTYTRLGSRVLFLTMCVLIGASMATYKYNKIDYYGPVRVTSVELEFFRPQQDIDKYNQNPSYYYYYQLAEVRLH